MVRAEAPRVTLFFASEIHRCSEVIHVVCSSCFHEFPGIPSWFFGFMNWWHTIPLFHGKKIIQLLIIDHYIYIYLDNPACAKLSLEIRNSNNYRRLSKFSLFPVFFRRFSFHILGSWFFSPFRRVFSPVRWVFSPFQKPANVCNMRKMQNLFRGRKTCRQQYFPKRQ